MSATFKTLEQIDARLAKHGVPAMSPFWRDTYARFYEHPTARTAVLRVGRRGGKGLSATKIAINEALFGDWTIPPGEVHRFAFVSVSKDEASERLRLIESCLRNLGVKFTAKGDEIFLADRPLAFRVCAATVAATSGFTCIGASIDEGTKWGDHDSADPGDEVLTSVRAMCATHKRARILLPSSPWGFDDWHARRYNAGESRGQIVAYAPSWVANPTLEEDELREEVSPLHFEREYLAEPGDTDTAAFGSKGVIAAFNRTVEPSDDGTCWILIDSSQLASAGGDDFAIAVAAPARGGGLCLLEVTGCNAARGDTMVDAVDTIEALAEKYGTTTVFGDKFESGGLGALLAQRGLYLNTPPWSVQSKHEAGGLLARLFREGAIALPEHSRMRNELMTLKARMRQNGMLEYPTNGKDYAALLFVLCHAVHAGLVPAEALSLTFKPTPEQWNAAIDAINSEFAEDDGPANAEQALQARTDSMFDLRRERLLRAAGVTPPEDCGHDDERKPSTLLDGFRWMAEQRKKRSGG